ncbi:hypothetical protein CHS0354_004342 [Potamilus streckersoni]|uniref:CCHC-type domain-containing protein n=1 Tax=Potamilus streckersoni TaxID=2493646 RepID=A0AAE0SH13_9BIVA|nr:hypothetical protein CHS0354_004342 [Potamilus streckersoni]
MLSGLENKPLGGKITKYFLTELKVTAQGRFLMTYRRPGVQEIDLTNFSEEERLRPTEVLQRLVATGVKPEMIVKNYHFSRGRLYKISASFYVMRFIIKTWYKGCQYHRTCFKCGNTGHLLKDCCTKNTAIVAANKKDQEVVAGVLDPLEQNEEIRTVEVEVIQQTNNKHTNERNNETNEKLDG